MVAYFNFLRADFLKWMWLKQLNILRVQNPQHLQELCVADVLIQVILMSIIFEHLKQLSRSATEKIKT